MFYVISPPTKAKVHTLLEVWGRPATMIQHMILLHILNKQAGIHNQAIN